MVLARDGPNQNPPLFEGPGRRGSAGVVGAAMQTLHLEMRNLPNRSLRMPPQDGASGRFHRQWRPASPHAHFLALVSAAQVLVAKSLNGA